MFRLAGQLDELFLTEKNMKQPAITVINLFIQTVLEDLKKATAAVKAAEDKVVQMGDTLEEEERKLQVGVYSRENFLSIWLVF